MSFDEQREPGRAGDRLATYPDLVGKVALVTGGSGGLGRAACQALARNGARVAVNGRHEAAVASVVDALRASGSDVAPAVADCTDAAALDRMRRHIEARLGPVDVLLAFAGGGRVPQPTSEIPEADWRADVDGNLTATFLTLRALLPAMIAHGRGSIVTMASSAARRPGGAPVAYAAAKAGVIALTQHVAHEVAAAGVRANCLAPATIMTGRMEQAMPPDRQRELAASYPLGRLGRPDDVAQAALFLASDASSWITGVTLDIAGGQVVR
jgi:3-oxoacyl-[acyl-carrier protein] reductase